MCEESGFGWLLFLIRGPLQEAGCSGVNDAADEGRQRSEFNGERVALTAWINSRSNDSCFGCCAGHAGSERRSCAPPLIAGRRSWTLCSGCGALASKNTRRLSATTDQRKGPPNLTAGGPEGNWRRSCWSSPDTPRSYRCSSCRDERASLRPPMPRDVRPRGHPRRPRRAPPSDGDVLRPGRLNGTVGPHGPGGLARSHFGLSEVRRRDRGRLGGFVAKYMGDGVLIFGYPQAHEDDAERAVRAGLELVAAVAA